MKKKAQTLSMNTVIILIIAVIVLVAVIILWAKYGGQLISTFKQQTNASIDLLPKK